MEDELSFYFENHPEHESDMFYNVDAALRRNTDKVKTAKSKLNNNRIKKQIILNEDAYYKEMFQLKELKICIERCDKIWETLKLIRDVQYTPTIPPSLSKSSTPKSKPSNSKFKGKLITYDNLPEDPNYSIIADGDNRYFHCNECGKDFTRFLPLRHHAFKVHTYFIPPLRIYSKSSNNTMLPTPVEESKRPRRLSKSSITSPTTPKQDIEQLKEAVEQIVESKIDINPPEESNEELNNVENELRHRCILCKRVCKNIRKHVVEYHKILYPEAIVTQCMATSQSETADTKVKAEDEGKNVAKKKPANSSLDTSLQLLEDQTTLVTTTTTTTTTTYNKCKNGATNRFVATSPVYKEYQCADCSLVFFGKRGLANHSRIHMKKAIKETRKAIKRLRDEKNNLTKLAKKLKKNEEDSECHNDDIMCDCGRSFRNPHTFYLHKSKCVKVDAEDSSSATRNSSDRDSGIGISITIKKKNNSYEIVNKDKSADTSSVNSCDVDSTGEESEVEDDKRLVMPYSKNHSILKLQTAEDEDEEVDIEDDCRENFGEVIVNCDSSSELTTNKAPQEVANELPPTTETKLEVNAKPLMPMLVEMCRKVITDNDSHLSMESLKPKAPKAKPKPKSPKLACDSLITVPTDSLDDYDLEPEPKDDNLPMLKSRRRRFEQLCLCGKKFRSTYFLNLHVKKLHPRLLHCGYCNTTFDDYVKYDKHDCQVTEKPVFDENLFKTPCPICKVPMEFQVEKFDRHTMTHHFDPVLPFLCFICSERFENAAKRRLHFRYHKLPACEICNKSLFYELQIKHNLYHQGIGYPCHPCKRAYSRRATLIRHRTKVHNNAQIDRLVTCEICSKQMKSQSLRKHRYMHSIECKCLKCGEQKFGEQNLQLHIDKKHQNDYPYFKCESCEMQFVLKKLLDKHLFNGDCNGYNHNSKDIQFVNIKPVAVQEIPEEKEVNNVKEKILELKVKKCDSNLKISERNEDVKKVDVNSKAESKENKNEIVIPSDVEIEFVMEGKSTEKKKVHFVTINTTTIEKKEDVAINSVVEQPKDCNENNSELEVVFSKEVIKSLKNLENEGLEIVFTKSNATKQSPNKEDAIIY